MAQCEQGNEILKAKSCRIQWKPCWVFMVGFAAFLCVCVCVCVFAKKVVLFINFMWSWNYLVGKGEKSTLDQ